MEIDSVTSLISSVGFPIVCVIFMAIFIYKFSQTVLSYNKEREDKLYELVGKCQANLDKFEDMMHDYITILGKLRDDVNRISHDIEEVKHEKL